MWFFFLMEGGGFERMKLTGGKCRADGACENGC